MAYGQHCLNVKFQKSLVRVPFRMLTKEEEQFLSKNYKSIEKQVEEAFKPKKKWTRRCYRLGAGKPRDQAETEVRWRLRR